MDSIADLDHALHQAKTARRDGHLSEREFYRTLLDLSATLLSLLQRELADREVVMAAHQVRRQIPLLLVMLEEQIALFQARQV